MTSRGRHNRWRAVLLASTALLAAPVVHAQTQWTGTVSSDWFAAGNWSTGTVPVAADNIVLDRVTPRPTVIGSPGAQGHDLIVGDGSTGQLTIQSGGTLSLTSVGPQLSLALIGRGSSATGVVTVTGAGSTWSNDDVIIGDSGNGTLRIESGGTVSNLTGAVGYFAGSIGTVDVSGPGSTWNNDTLFVGYKGGGTLRIENGGKVSSAGSTVADEATSSGAVIVTGAGSTWTSSFFSLTVGDKGTGSLRIENGGSVSNGFGDVALSAGSNAAVTVSGAGATWSNSDDLAIAAKGTGTLRIEDGGKVSSKAGYVGQATGSIGKVSVSGAGSTWTNSGALVIGDRGTGTLRIETGGKVSNTIGTIAKSNADAAGAVTVTGVGSTWINLGGLTVGEKGSGTLRIEDDATVSNTFGLVGGEAGSSGSVTVIGTRATWTNNGDLSIGHKGTGSLRIENGGSVSTLASFIGDAVGSNGTVTVIGTGSTWTDFATVSVGSSGTGVLRIESGGSVNHRTSSVGSAAGSSGTATVSGAGSTWTSSSDLTIGYAGTGALHIESGGTVITNGIGWIGRLAGAKGSVLVTGTGATWTADFLAVGDAGSGSVTVSEGGKASPGSTRVGAQASGDGTIAIRGAGSTWTTGDFTLGHSSTGTLTVTDGGAINTINGELGSGTGVTGKATVSGAGSTWNSRLFRVGNAGTGALTIANGGSVSVANAGQFDSVIGDGGNATGDVTVTGAGSTWSIGGNLVVGRAGTASLMIRDGGRVQANAIAVAANAGSDGFVNIGAVENEVAAPPGTLQATSLTFGAGFGVLTLNHNSTNYAFATPIAGSGAIRHIGGTTAFTADSSTFTGNTHIRGGILRVDGRLGGLVAVGSAGVLGGIGTILDRVMVDGTLSAGASPGTLSIGTLTLHAGATSRFELNTPGVAGGSDPVTGNDLVAVAGNLILGGALDARTAAAGYYTLFTYGGTLTGAFASTAVTGTRGFAVTSHQVQTDIAGQVNLTVVGDRQALQFWDGADTAGNGIVDGGAGTWSAEGTNWTGQPGQATTNSNWGGSVAVFAGAAGGAVTVAGAQAFDTLQFAANGYVLGGGSLALSPATGVASTITVDGGVTATIATPLVRGSGDSLLKVGAGTLVLTGASIYERTTIDGGLLAVSGGAITNATVTVGDLGAGALRIDTGGSFSSQSGIVGQQAGANGTVTVSGAGATWSNSGNLFVGDVGTGTLRVETGGAVSTMIGYVGHAAGANGTVTVNGAGSSWTTGLLLVGNRGTGTLRIENGGAVSNTVGFVGAQAGSNGTVVASGAGSTWTSSEALTIGVGGHGILTITDGARVNATAGIGVGRPDAGGDGGGAGGTGTINIGAAAGDPAAAPGTLQAPTLTFGAGTGMLVFNHTGDTSFAPAITGAGTIRHVAGTTVLSADSSTFTGSTTVDGGILRVDGTLGGTVSVMGGALGGSGTVGGVIANSGGTVAPGNSIGTMTVAGNVSFAPGSTYAVEIEPGGAGDRLHATGTATLSGGTVSVIKAAGAYTAGTRYIILTADAGVTGTFAGLTQNLPFVDLALAYGPSSVFLDVTRNSTGFCDIAASRNQCAAARGVESLGAGNRLYDAVASLPDAASARRAFNALSGEIHASTRSALIEDSHYLRDAIVTRARLSGVSTGAAPQFAALAQATDQSQRPQDGTAITAWFQGFGAIARTSGDGNAATAKRTTGGFFIGADTRIADTWTIGLATGYSRSTIDVDGRSSRATIDSYHLALYGGAQFGPVGVRFGAAHTWHSIDSSRSITFPGLADAARADYKARTTQVFGDVGYALSLGDVALEPFANLAWVHLSTNRFGERGGIAALRARGGSDSSLFSTLGIRAAAQVWNEDNKTLTLRGTLGWRHAFGDVTPAARLAFAGGTSFGVEGVPIARNAVVIEAGFDLKIGSSFTVGAGYAGVLASGARDHAFKGNLTYRF